MNGIYQTASQNKMELAVCTNSKTKAFVSEIYFSVNYFIKTKQESPD